jgi:PAS domain S-box-containing protein
LDSGRATEQGLSGFLRLALQGDGEELVTAVHTEIARLPFWSGVVELGDDLLQSAVAQIHLAVTHILERGDQSELDLVLETWAMRLPALRPHNWAALASATQKALLPRLRAHYVDNPEKLAFATIELFALTTWCLERALFHRENAHEFQFLGSVIEHIPYMIFVKDARDLRFVAFNRAGEQLLGYSREELLGKNDYDFFPRDEADFFTQKDRHVLAHRQPVDIPEEPIHTRTGSRWLHTQKIPIFGSGGEPIFLLGISEDITDRKRVLAELGLAKDAAEAGSRAKSEFLARMSHEIRTPMNALVSMLDLALDTELTAGQREYLSLANDSAVSLQRIIDDILDFSRIEAGRIELEALPFDLRALVDGLGRITRLRAQQRGLTVEVDVGDEVPYWLIGDSGRLRQVITNLLDNALRFTEKGTITLEVVRDFPASDANGQGRHHRGDIAHLRFTVRDTGIGIAEEKRAAVFDSFVQADGSITRRYGGTGLGLAIAQALVRVMGGEIAIGESDARGTTIYFMLNLRVAAENAAAQATRPMQAAPPLRLLLAEDNPVNQEVVLRLLEGSGHNVDIVADGNAAVEACARAQYDLVLMDLEMPGVDGWEATRRIRTARPHTPIIALTAHALPEHRERCRQAGMSHFLAKPVRRGQLLAAIARVAGEPTRSITPLPLRAPSPKRDLTSLFLEGAERDLSSMETAILDQRSEELKRTAHSLAGAAAVLNFSHLMGLARRLEQAASRSDWAVARHLCAELRSELSTLVA